MTDLPSPKIYRGNPEEHQRDPRKSVIVQERGRLQRFLDLRLDLANHSPDGFSWGYMGSGPAQLALALLVDATTNKKTKRNRRAEIIAEEFYQQFKEEVISHLDQDKGWRLSEWQIKDWLSPRVKAKRERQIAEALGQNKK